MRATIKAMPPALGQAPPGARADASTSIARALLALPEIAAARRVMAYLAMPDEPDLDELFTPSATTIWCAPRVDWTSGLMHPRVITDPARDVMAPARGPRAPADATPALDPASLDAVILPGLAFDPQGRRLGRGGGYYDRFLPLAPRAVRIGVAFESRVVDRVPQEPHDTGVDILVTEVSTRRPGRAAGP